MTYCARGFLKFFSIFLHTRFHLVLLGFSRVRDAVGVQARAAQERVAGASARRPGPFHGPASDGHLLARRGGGRGHQDRRPGGRGAGMKNPAIGGGAYLGGAVAATKNRDKSMPLFWPLRVKGARASMRWSLTLGLSAMGATRVRTRIAENLSSRRAVLTELALPVLALDGGGGTVCLGDFDSAGLLRRHHVEDARDAVAD